MPRKNLNLWKILQGVARTKNVHFVDEYQRRSLVDHVEETNCNEYPFVTFNRMAAVKRLPVHQP